jgi:aryl-alcohol dehydrogenase-like predicted oxidoreductase
MTLPAIRAACEGSLSRLSSEWIDLYRLHDGELDPALAADALGALEELVAEGKIRWYGWSTDDPERARVFAAGEHCCAIEHRLGLSSDNAEMLAVCDEFDRASIVGARSNAGVLTGKFTPTSTFTADDSRVDVDFSEGLGALRLRQIEEVRRRPPSPGS